MMVFLIHRKRVPLLHITVLILCDEGGGFVAVTSIFMRKVTILPQTWATVCILIFFNLAPLMISITIIIDMLFCDKWYIFQTPKAPTK